MKKFVLLIAVFFCAQALLGQSQINASFKQHKLIKASGKNVEAAGKIVYKSPDNLQMNYTQPAGDFFIIEGNTVRMNMNGKKSTVDVTKNMTMKAQKNTLLNCIKGNYRQVAADNNADCVEKETGGAKTVTITARKAATRGYSKIVLSYRTSDNMVTEMTLEEFNGNVTQYSISNITVKK